MGGNEFRQPSDRLDPRDVVSGDFGVGGQPGGYIWATAIPGANVRKGGDWFAGTVVWFHLDITNANSTRVKVTAVRFGFDRRDGWEICANWVAPLSVERCTWQIRDGVTSRPVVIYADKPVAIVATAQLRWEREEIRGDPRSVDADEQLLSVQVHLVQSPTSPTPAGEEPPEEPGGDSEPGGPGAPIPE